MRWPWRERPRCSWPRNWALRGWRCSGSSPMSTAPQTYPPRGSGPRSRSTNVGSDVFEASGGRLRFVGRVRVGIGIDNGYLVVNAPIANTVAAAEDGIPPICAMVLGHGMGITIVME
ncbi:hypothetical protein ZWY2020_009312 [Hordeum vulgare]|nr:hypothetical protein ZWY2020_009312 [Hordeum vulgare]